MKRTFGIVCVLLGLALTPFYSSAHRRIPNQAIKKRNDVTLRTQPSTATIIFRGLMAFHPDPARQYVEIGILRVPEHEFRIRVRENSSNGVSIFTLPLAQLGSPQHDLWFLEFAAANGQGVRFYQSEPFDRNSGVGDEKDFRWLIDLEGKEFYDRHLATKSEQPALVLRMSGGDFYTKKRTLPLMRKKGDGRFQYFGRVADELATDISLDEGDIVLRSEKAGREILRLTARPETTYEITIENAFVGDHHMSSSLNHFRYYYGLVTEPQAEWYEFRAVKGADFASARLRMASHVTSVAPLNDEAPCMLIGLGGGH